MKKENGIEPEAPEIRSREDAIRELERPVRLTAPRACEL